MPVFAYRTLGSGASSEEGTISADTARQARDLLRDKGLVVSDIRLIEEEKKGLRLFGRRKSREEVTAFIGRLSTLLRAGIPLLQALRTLADQHHRRFRPVVQELAEQVSAGASLAEAMARRPDYFDDLCVSIAEVGESTGALDAALRRLAGFREKAEQLRGRITTALLYPSIVAVVGLVVSIFLMTYVVPNLLETLSKAGKDLPAITRVVKAISDFLVGYWWLPVGGLVGLAVAIKYLKDRDRVRGYVDRLVLRLPLVGDLVRKETTSRIAVVLATLLRSGLPFVRAVQITRATISNRVFRQAMEEYEKAVTAGSDVAGPLKASGVFSPMAVEMLAVGQQSGELESLLEQVAEAYDREVSTAVQRLTIILEPVLIVCLAVVIGFIILATILPILEASHVL